MCIDITYLMITCCGYSSGCSFFGIGIAIHSAASAEMGDPQRRVTSLYRTASTRERPMKKLFLLGAISTLVTLMGTTGTAKADHRSHGYGYSSPSFSLYYGSSPSYYGYSDPCYGSGYYGSGYYPSYYSGYSPGYYGGWGYSGWSSGGGHHGHHGHGHSGHGGHGHGGHGHH